jgi:hypothetical protein
VVGHEFKATSVRRHTDTPTSATEVWWQQSRSFTDEPGAKPSKNTSTLRCRRGRGLLLSAWHVRITPDKQCVGVVQESEEKKEWEQQLQLRSHDGEQGAWRVITSTSLHSTCTLSGCKKNSPSVVCRHCINRNETFDAVLLDDMSHFSICLSRVSLSLVLSQLHGASYMLICRLFTLTRSFTTFIFAGQNIIRLAIKLP